jgi:hypothetical protein
MGAEYRHLLAHASEKVKRADFTLMADAIASPAFTLQLFTAIYSKQNARGG